MAKEERKVDAEFYELIIFISNTFEPAGSQAEATLELSTHEVYEKLQELYPSHSYKVEDVYKNLKSLGFKYGDSERQMNFKWLFKSK